MTDLVLTRDLPMKNSNTPLDKSLSMMARLSPCLILFCSAVRAAVKASRDANGPGLVK